jgi:membrane associated rhomboid family serine protease
MCAFISQAPRWLRFAERKLQWLAIPNIAVILITLQALGFLFVMMDPLWLERLALEPALVVSGEYWRLITFLALPLSMSPIWVIFALWFLYFVVNAIENEWGAFKTTLYVLVSVILMIAFSLVFGYPITNIAGFESTLFLAAAALFPEMQIQLFLVFPVKMKWLAWLTLALVVFNFISGSWIDRVYLLAIYSNYLLFFGSAQIYSLKQIYRKWKFKSKLRE